MVIYGMPYSESETYILIFAMPCYKRCTQIFALGDYRTLLADNDPLTLVSKHKHRAMVYYNVGSGHLPSRQQCSDKIILRCLTEYQTTIKY